jgi:putative ABC transport system ATP-binding protein
MTLQFESFAPRPLGPIGNGRAGGVSVSVRGLGHTYLAPSGPLTVLTALDLHVGAGDYVSVRGPSGVGKSTLLALLGGLERVREGSISVDGRGLSGLAGDDLAAYRRSTVGFVFQHFGLLESLTAAENVELALVLSGTSPPARRARARELLGAVGLGGRADHRPAQLSGGERQRVAIARALANDPSLILADEPTGNLDQESGVRVVQLLEAINESRGCTLIVVTHNRSLARRARTRLILTSGGLAPTDDGGSYEGGRGGAG